MRRGEQNQQRAEKQHDEFIQEAEETRSRLHPKIPTGHIISHATGGRQILWRRESVAAGIGKIATATLILIFECVS
jgi:hypothetical protein